MESPLNGVEFTQPGGEYTPMYQVLNEDTRPSVTFLEGNPNPMVNQANFGSEPLPAWMLHLFWGSTGAFEANDNVRKDLLQQLLGGGNTWKPNTSGKPSGGQCTLEINVGAFRNRSSNDQEEKEEDSDDENETKMCWTCSVKLPPDEINLCSRCKRAVYCSRACQKDDWAQHKRICRAPP